MAIILGETGRNDVCLLLGKQGEHDVTFFEFDFSLWAAEYGDGVLSLRLTPNGSATAYPVTLDFDGTIATFTVTATDTATAGLGSAELVYIVGDDEKLKKSVTFVTSVEPSDDTGEAPEPYDEWLAHLEVLAGETSQAKTDAEQAASEAKASEQAAAASEQNAKTSENNAEEYADRIVNLTVSAHEATGETPTVIKTIVNDVYNLDFGLVPGKDGEDGKDGQDGADGVGIASVALNSDYTLTITLTDGRTYTTTSIRGEQGETGATPDFSIGTVTTLSPGSQATATITGTDEEPVLNLGIPKGDPGDVSSDGYYPELYAGGLVTDKGETDTAPYTFRASKALGYRESLNQIVGGTVAWNQLVQNGDFANADGWISDYATLSVSDNMLTYTSTMASGSAAVLGNVLGTVNGHKYLVSADIKCNNTLPASGVWLGSGGHDGIIRTVSELSKWTNISGVFVRGTGGNDRISLYPRSTLWNNGDTCNIRNIVCFDLTAMFGSTIADYIYSLEQANSGAGVAWFRKLFPKPYYEYNAGELMSVQAVSHDMVGFNQFDKSTATDGKYVNSRGTEVVSTPYGHSDYIKVLPNTTYHMTGYGGNGIYAVLACDINKNPISTYYGGASKTEAFDCTLPSDCHYVILNYLVEQKDTVCFNLSWDGSRDGEYEPYVKHSYPLDSSLTLRGIPKLDANNNLYYDGDTYEADGTVTRKYGVVDLGTLTWGAPNGSGRTSAPAGAKPIPASTDLMNLICDKYITITARQWYDSAATGIAFCGSGYGTPGNVGIVDPSFIGKTAEEVKTALSGIYLVYELATPTTETADTYQQIQVCDPDGTEAFTDYGVESGDRDVAIPVGHSTFYPMDLKGKLEDIPDIPEAPASNGTYTLKAVRSNTGVVYSWVSG